MPKGKFPPFIRQPPFRVARKPIVGNDGEEGRISPETIIDDEPLFFCVRVAKLGYFGGDLERVLAAPCDAMQTIVEFEAFESEFEKEYIALNKPKT